MKKIKLFVLIFLLLFLLPGCGSENKSNGGLDYLTYEEIDNVSCKAVFESNINNGKKIDLFIPDYNDGKKVTEVLFANNVEIINSIYFGRYVKKIRNLGGNRSIKSIKFDEKSEFEYIENRSFQSLFSLESIYLPNSLKTIGSDAFHSCSNLKNIVLPNGVEYIGKNAFSYCTSLTDLNIPSSVIRIDDNAFDGCKSLSNLAIDGHIRAFGYVDFSSLTSLPRTEFGNAYYCGTTTNPYYFLVDYSTDNPPYIEINKNCKYISESFSKYNVRYDGSISQWCDICIKDGSSPSSFSILKNNYDNEMYKEYEILREIVIPNNVEIIGNYQFCGILGDVKRIYISDSVKYIGTCAFSSVRNDCSIRIPNNLEYIDCNAFYFENSNESIGLNDYEGSMYLGNENNPYVYLYSYKKNSTINENCKIAIIRFNPFYNDYNIIIPNSVVQVYTSSLDNYDYIKIGKNVKTIYIVDGFYDKSKKNIVDLYAKDFCIYHTTTSNSDVYWFFYDVRFRFDIDGTKSPYLLLFEDVKKDNANYTINFYGTKEEWEKLGFIYEGSTVVFK